LKLNVDYHCKDGYFYKKIQILPSFTHPHVYHFDTSKSSERDRKNNPYVV